MPKAILEFNLPEERSDFCVASRAGKWFSAIYDFDQWLRAKLKYEELPDEVDALYQGCRDKLHECMSDEGIAFSDLE